jgi:hypothetical protein
MHIVLECAVPVSGSGMPLPSVLAAWATERGYRLAHQEGNQRVYERGVRGWRRLFVTAVTDIPTRIHLCQDTNRALMFCRLRCASWIHLKTPAWLLDDRWPLQQDLECLGRWLGMDKAQFDEVIASGRLPGLA